MIKDIIQIGRGGPVIYWLKGNHEPREAEHLLECLQETVRDTNFTLVALNIDDWNGELSPWPGNDPMGGEGGFAGNGKKTLDELLEIISKQPDAGNKKKFLIGYSLAGLFALWTMYKTDAFDGAACCSGSLWFDGWETFAREHTIAGGCDIYLSLGGKEDKTANPVMV